MKIQISDHQDKSFALRDALADHGHEIVKYDPDILLIDFDGGIAHYPIVIERAYESGALIYMYSHGAMPITAWDGVVKPSPLINGYLAQSPGQKWVMEAYGYPHPVHVIGWHYCQQQPFSPPSEPKKLLFAPWHPHGDGWMLPEGKALNTELFDNLIQLRFDLTCRIIFGMEANGLRDVPGVSWQMSDRKITSSIEAIKAADVVVAYGTFAYLAIALGKPTVMYGQGICPQDGYSPETLKYVKSWDKYRDYMRYPYDADGLGPYGVNDVIHRACKTEAADWRERFIGEQFTPSGFVTLLERLRQDNEPLW